jgi:hypothetical protein
MAEVSYKDFIGTKNYEKINSLKNRVVSFNNYSVYVGLHPDHFVDEKTFFEPWFIPSIRKQHWKIWFYGDNNKNADARSFKLLGDSCGMDKNFLYYIWGSDHNNNLPLWGKISLSGLLDYNTTKSCDCSHFFDDVSLYSLDDKWFLQKDPKLGGNGLDCLGIYTMLVDNNGTYNHNDIYGQPRSTWEYTDPMPWYDKKAEQKNRVALFAVLRQLIKEKSLDKKKVISKLRDIMFFANDQVNIWDIPRIGKDFDYYRNRPQEQKKYNIVFPNPWQRTVTLKAVIYDLERRDGMS